jgi:hypothetical protein
MDTGAHWYLSEVERENRDKMVHAELWDLSVCLFEGSCSPWEYIVAYFGQ